MFIQVAYASRHSSRVDCTILPTTRNTHLKSNVSKILWNLSQQDIWAEAEACIRNWRLLRGNFWETTEFNNKISKANTPYGKTRGKNTQATIEGRIPKQTHEAPWTLSSLRYLLVVWVAAKLYNSLIGICLFQSLSYPTLPMSLQMDKFIWFQQVNKFI